MRSIPPGVRVLTMAAALSLQLVLGACGSSGDNQEELATLDDSLTGQRADTDPAQGRIVVDPALAGKSDVGAGQHAGGSAKRGVSATELDGAPLMTAPQPQLASAEDCANCSSSQGAQTLGAQTLGARASVQSGARGTGACEAKLTYGASWAARLPPEFPDYPNGRVQEAAGVDGGKCNIRVVSYTTSAPMKQVVDYYYTRARRSGYSAEYVLRGGDHVLGGVRSRDDGAYVIIFQPRRDGGTAIDLVANNGG